MFINRREIYVHNLTCVPEHVEGFIYGHDIVISRMSQQAVVIITFLMVCQIIHHGHGDSKRPSSVTSEGIRRSPTPRNDTWETIQQMPPKSAPTLKVPYNLIGCIPLILFVVLGVAVWLWLCPTYGKKYVRFKHSEV